MSEADPELPDVEFYTLPDLSDLAYWDRLQAAGLHQPAPDTNGIVATLRGAWTWVDLTDPTYAIPPNPPEVAGLLYAGKRHVASGPQESAKTLICYHLLLQALRTQHGVAIIDFEMGPVATRRMLTDLGCLEDELPHIHYTEPSGPPVDQDIDRLAGLGVEYVLIDASAGAFDTTGLDDNSRKDAETFARTWIQPLFRQGIATIVLDHVTKNTETRGKYAIGSERKTGGADVHLGFEALKTLTRGGNGTVKITAHKDRGAYLPRPTAAIVKLTSDSNTHAVTITVEPPEPIDPDQPIKHTIYAERVCRTLQLLDPPASQKQVEDNTEGNSTYIRKAIDELEAGGYIRIDPGPRNAKLITLILTYETTSSDLVRTSSGHGQPSDLVRPPLTRGRADEVGDAATDEENQPTSSDPFDVYDPTIQHLLDDTPDW